MSTIKFGNLFFLCHSTPVCPISFIFPGMQQGSIQHTKCMCIFVLGIVLGFFLMPMADANHMKALC